MGSRNWFVIHESRTFNSFSDNDDPIIIIKESKQAIHYIYFFIFSLLSSHYVADLIKKKLELRLMIVSVSRKIKFGHALISERFY